MAIWLRCFLLGSLLALIATSDGFQDAKCNRCEPITHSSSSIDPSKLPSVEECKPHIQEAVRQCQPVADEEVPAARGDQDSEDDQSDDSASDETGEEAEVGSQTTAPLRDSPVESVAESESTEDDNEDEQSQQIDEEQTKEDESDEKTDEKEDDSKTEEEKSEESKVEDVASEEDDSKEETAEDSSSEEEEQKEKKSEEEESVKESEETEEESVEKKEEAEESKSEEVKETKESEDETEEESVESKEEKKETEDQVKKLVEEPPPQEKDTAEESEESEESLEEDAEEEEEEEEDQIILTPTKPYKSRNHIEDILGLDDIGSQEDLDNERFIMQSLRDLKKIYDTAIKPLESLYKYRDLTSRHLGDAEIFAKPMVLFIGPWSAGKSSIINYLLGVERTGQALKTGVEPTDTQFTVITHGEDHTKVSGTEMASDWAYSSVQKFGQNFLNHFRGIKMASPLLQKIVLVDTPGIIENRKMYERGYPVNDAFQWFIDRADAIYVVFDPAKMEIGNELESLLDQLKGRESQVRFVLNKADTIRKSDLMRVIGQLFWNLSPLLGSSEAPVIYAVSLMTKPFHPGAPTKFLLDQELMFLADLRDTVDKRVENRILFARRHAVRVRNHAKLVDCYLNTYYRHKSIFSSKKKIAEQITEHPGDYSIYEGISTLTNVSRYDLPDPGIYRDFFRLNPLYDFRPLTSTCSYFRGCPLDKLDNAISYDIMQILGQYKKKCKALSGDKDESR